MHFRYIPLPYTLYPLPPLTPEALHPLPLVLPQPQSSNPTQRNTLREPGNANYCNLVELAGGMTWPVTARRLGRIGWAQAEQVQAGLVALRKAGAEASAVPPVLRGVAGLTGLTGADLDSDSLLLCEHPPVYTAGRKVKFAPEEEVRIPPAPDGTTTPPMTTRYSRRH